MQKLHTLYMQKDKLIKQEQELQSNIAVSKL